MMSQLTMVIHPDLITEDALVSMFKTLDLNPHLQPNLIHLDDHPHHKTETQWKSGLN